MEKPLDLQAFYLAHTIFFSNILKGVEFNDIMFKPFNHLVASLVKVEKLFALVFRMNKLEKDSNWSLVLNFY